MQWLVARLRGRQYPACALHRIGGVHARHYFGESQEVRCSILQVLGAPILRYQGRRARNHRTRNALGQIVGRQRAIGFHLGNPIGCENLWMVPESPLTALGHEKG